MNDENILWQAFFAGWLLAQGKTVKDLGLAFTGLGGENQLKEEFQSWRRKQRDTSN